jgi:pyridoxal phosphate enzyme (YggS family)
VLIMLLDNLTEIKERIARAALRANRSPEDIKLVAVSKRVPSENILKAVEIGQTVFGENYVQEALEKIPYIKSSVRRDVAFHFIGKLQSNKAKKAAELFDVIETVDSVKLGQILEKHCATLDKSLEVFIQVNIGAEKQKSGIRPQDCEMLLRELTQCRFLRISGLMTMPPYSVDPENVRPFFKHLRQLSEELSAKGLLGQHGPVELSMGISNDFEVAIEEGSTVVRIGTALFGARPL